MAASPYELEDPAGFPSNPQWVGQLAMVVKDVVWTGDGANETADATIEPGDVGLSTLIGGWHLGDVGALYSGTDTIASARVDVGTGDAVVHAYADWAAGALDIDATDVAALRVVLLGF